MICEYHISVSYSSDINRIVKFNSNILVMRSHELIRLIILIINSYY